MHERDKKKVPLFSSKIPQRSDDQVNMTEKKTLTSAPKYQTPLPLAKHLHTHTNWGQKGCQSLKRQERKICWKGNFHIFRVFIHSLTLRKGEQTRRLLLQTPSVTPKVG